MPSRPSLLLPCFAPLLFAGLAGCGGGEGGGGTPIPVFGIATIGRASPVINDLGERFPALVGFRLAYTNGDHHAFALAVGATGTGAPGSDPTFILRLEDGDTGLNNPRDPVEMSASFIDLRDLGPSDVEVGVTSGFDLNGVAQLPLDPPVDPGGFFVLSGFEFRTDGSNHHLRVLRITPRPDLGYVEVEYRDDSPDDDLYFASVVYAVLRPRPASEGSEGLELAGPFEARFPFLGGGRADRMPGTAVLHGFSLEYREGDRHLNDIAVELDQPASILAGLADGDTGSDDFVDARVSYVLVSR